jgi:hypothetical protein
MCNPTLLGAIHPTECLCNPRSMSPSTGGYYLGVACKVWIPVSMTSFLTTSVQPTPPRPAVSRPRASDRLSPPASGADQRGTGASGRIGTAHRLPATSAPPRASGPQAPPSPRLPPPRRAAGSATTPDPASVKTIVQEERLFSHQSLGGMSSLRQNTQERGS